MTRAQDIVILEGARTPIGAFLGGLSRVSPTELGVHASRAALERSGVSPKDIDAIYFGNVIQSSPDAAYIARHVGLDIGAPTSTPALTVNRACGSGLEAIVCGARSLMLGEATCVLAGGAENMSMTPYAMRGVRQGWKLARQQVDDMLMTSLHDTRAGCSIGETVEHLASAHDISRADADAFSVWGQARAAAARERGDFAHEIVAVQTPGCRGRLIEHDEAPRPDTTLEALSGLPGLYGRDGVVTAGNSCGLNDAGAAVVLTTNAWATARELRPLGRLLSWGIVGIEPMEMGRGPVLASQKALAAAGLTVDDMDVVEINDSFAVQYLAVERELGLDRERVNPNGGAIALGHPLAATGTRLVHSALKTLERTGGRRALCTICIGGGQGMAVVVERA